MAKMFIDEVHAQNVLQGMWEQSQNKEFCDVSLIPGDGETQISAHRSVLSASSEYFKTMFTPKFKESTAKEVKLPNTDSETLKSLVKFCYSGRLEMSEDTVEKLLITADSLLLDVVVNACGNFLAEQLHPTNCLGMAQLAERHHCDSLSKKAIDFCMKHFVELYKTDDFLNLSVKQMAHLLSSDELCDPTEEHVFKSLITWLEHDRSEREQHKDEMLKLVRLPLMKPSFLIKYVQPVCTSLLSSKLYMKATDFYLMPELRTIASESTKPRTSAKRLMAIKRANNRLSVLYHCPQRFKWMKWLENLEYREDFGVAVMENDLFILGGKTGGAIVNTVICINLKTMIQKDVNPMIQRRSHFGVALIKGFLCVVGGFDGINQIRSVEKWDSKSNAWSMTASMSVGRSCLGIAVYDGRLYVGGGYVNNTPSSSGENYNIQQDVWTTKASMCKARLWPWLTVANGTLYALGGDSKKTIERYDVVTNKWNLIFSFTESIPGRLCTTFDDKVIVLYMDRAEEYNTTTNKSKVNTSITGLDDVLCTFSFSGLLLDSKFIEN